ncbi:MAG: HPF/RaiA family ribosome-associated protein [Anaerolineae bacterium]|jgi:ribosome-associated translation inhibitor RaiA|nr:HPF/RaiA family ribosome-associated protein [Anaerolineae bacterium]
MNDQGFTQFHIDYYNEVNDDAGLQQEAEDRIRALADQHQDIIGAMVKLVPQAKGREVSFANEVTIRVFIRGNDIVVHEVGERPAQALHSALDSVERQVREHRARQRNR